LLTSLDQTANEKMKEVEARLRSEGFRSKDWADQVSAEAPVLVFGETNPVFAKWPSSPLAESEIFPITMSTALPMSPTAFKGFLQTLKNESFFSYVPEQQVLNLRIDPSHISSEPEAIIYRAGNFTQREALERITYEAFGLALMSPKKPEAGWSAARVVDPKRILNVLVADGLIASSAGSFYLRPNAQRDFVIKQLQEDVSLTDIVDLAGRKWQVFSFRLFGAMTMDTFCLPIPQGLYCQSVSFQAAHPELLKILRANFVRSQLTNRALPGFYSRVDAILDFQAKGLNEFNAPWNDFELRRDALGRLRLNFKHQGIHLELPEGVSENAAIESLRMNAGVMRDPKTGKAQWVSTGVEFIQAVRSEKLKKRYCEISYERKGSLTSSVLAALRAEEQSRERDNRKKKNKSLDDEPSPIWQKSIQSQKTKENLTLYAYCVPAERYGDAEQLLNFNFESREPLDLGPVILK
jgi:hypothetical protein